MANQTLTADFAQIAGIWRQAGLAVSLCTIKRRPSPPTVGPSGVPAQRAGDYTPVAGLTNIPCQLSVWRMKPDIAAVSRMQDRYDTLAERHLLLNDSYLGILQRDVATVDGTDYEIMAVEQPSQGGNTRLAVRLFTQ
jgi:hypothetical protein